MALEGMERENCGASCSCCVEQQVINKRAGQPEGSCTGCRHFIKAHPIGAGLEIARLLEKK